jgi:hypothetical protein
LCWIWTKVPKCILRIQKDLQRLRESVSRYYWHVVGWRNHETLCMLVLSAVPGTFRSFALTVAERFDLWTPKDSLTFSGTLNANPPWLDPYRTPITLPLINLSIQFAKSEPNGLNIYCVYWSTCRHYEYQCAGFTDLLLGEVARKYDVWISAWYIPRSQHTYYLAESVAVRVVLWSPAD